MISRLLDQCRRMLDPSTWQGRYGGSPGHLDQQNGDACDQEGGIRIGRTELERRRVHFAELVLSWLTHMNRSKWTHRLQARLTGLHWLSLSAATSWTFMFRLCDLPRVFISFCRTWQTAIGTKNNQHHAVDNLWSNLGFDSGIHVKLSVKSYFCCWPT